MAIYTIPSGPFDSTFNATFPRVPKFPGWSGGQFAYTFDESFSIRQFYQGSLGGSTFQVSGKNYAIRHHSIPTVKASVRMLSSMQVFRGNISRYQGTDAGQRATWEAEKVNYPKERNNGDAYFSNRYHLFIGSNQNLSYSTGNNILTIAARGPLLPIRLISANVNRGSQTALFEFNTATMPSGYACQLFTSRPVPVGNPSQARAALRLTRVFQPTESLNVDSWNDYAAAWAINPNNVGYMILAAAFIIPVNTGQKQDASSIVGSFNA